MAERRWLVGIAWLPVIGLALAALAPTGFWPARLALHWAPHLAVLALPAWCLAGRRWRPGLVILVAMLGALWPWLVAAHAPRAPQPTTPSFRAASANLWLWNTDPAAALAAITADVVVLIECDYGRCAPVRRDPRWPHQIWNAASGFDGLALLSRFPIRSQRVRFPADAPGIEAVLATPLGEVRVIAAHPWSPVRPRLDRRHHAQAQAFAQMVDEHPGPVLFLGDCNSSPAGATMRILTDTGLRPAAGTAPATWPTWVGPLGIAIDHILARDLALGPVTAHALPGSDHRWVVATVGR